MKVLDLVKFWIYIFNDAALLFFLIVFVFKVAYSVVFQYTLVSAMVEVNMVEVNHEKTKKGNANLARLIKVWVGVKNHFFAGKW